MNLKAARIEAGLTISQMSRILGIPINTIISWESGKRHPAAYVEKLIIAELKRI